MELLENILKKYNIPLCLLGIIFFVFSCSVSSEERRIIFQWGRDDPSGEIYTINPDGKEPLRLTFNPASTLAAFPPTDSHPIWSPDGKKIAFMSMRDNDNGVDVYVLNADGKQQKRLTHSGVISSEALAWSPDSKKLALVESGALTLFDVSSGSSSKILNDIPSTITWAPDGKKILLGGFLNGINNTMWLINSDGSDMRKFPSETVFGREPNWSPDGKRIVFTKTGRNEKGEHIVQGLFLINSDGTKLISLASARTRYPVWSPDNQRIAFLKEGKVALINPDGSKLKILFDNDYDNDSLTWSPDSKKLAFTHDAELYVANVENAQIQQITSGRKIALYPFWGR